jgi:hypothetical protein
VGKFDLSNVKDYILDLPLKPEIYEGSTNVKDYLTKDGYDWSTNNLHKLRDANVFAILWGGGNTQSIAKFPHDDNGYLYTHVLNYF